jgi:hypothetical protein
VTFPRIGTPRQKCRPGRRIASLDALVSVLMTEPSVWYVPSGRAMPSAGFLNWQIRVAINGVRFGQFHRVLRPKRPAVLP